MNGISRTRKTVLLGGIAAVLGVIASSAAQAQCVNSPVGGADLTPFVPFARGSSVNSMVSVLNTVTSAYLTQTNAFISAPPNPQPDQQGGGVWTRGIGGRVDTTANGVTSLIGFAPGVVPPTPAGNIACQTKTRTDFGGYQSGADLARLNVGGWNLHGGATVGYVEADAKDVSVGGTFRGNFQVPFVGLYGAATYGGFFADGQVRWDFFQNNALDVANGLFNQNFDARGISFSGNIGYNYGFANNWFIEPSAGVVYSRLDVDPLLVSGTLVLLNGGVSFPGTLQINTIESTLGRASVRVGTNLNLNTILLQPFFTASVFHEFSGNVTTTFNTCTEALLPFLGVGGGPGCGLATGTPNVNATLVTDRVGTYGQFALGVAGQIPDSGWLGYARVDVRTGDRIDGVSVNGGIRYQFTPEQIAAVTGKHPIYKAPPAPVATVYNWTGFYIGAYAGSNWGNSDWVFTLFNTRTNPRFGGFIGGGQAGYNYQTGNFVFGIEGDIGGTNSKGAKPCPVSFFFTCETHMDDVATVTGRVGYAWDRALVYAKGGLAVADTELRVIPNTDSQPFLGLVVLPSAAASKTTTGWTAGGGFEFGLTRNWSAKAEYLHYDFGTERFVLPGGGNGPVDAAITGNVVRVGVNYRFADWFPGPVVTKY